MPAGSQFETEADAIVDAIYAGGVPRFSVLKERIASNTSENFWLSAEVLRDNGLELEHFLIVQKPYTERRTLATARRRWPFKDVRITSEEVSFEKYCAGTISIARIYSMLTGEILRLDNYSRSGLIDLDGAVPNELIAIARKLQHRGYSARAIGSGHMGSS